MTTPDTSQDGEKQPFIANEEGQAIFITASILLYTITAIIIAAITAQHYSKPCSDPSLQYYCKMCKS